MPRYVVALKAAFAKNLSAIAMLPRHAAASVEVVAEPRGASDERQCHDFDAHTADLRAVAGDLRRRHRHVDARVAGSWSLRKKAV